jgi:hypothetical protein
VRFCSAEGVEPEAVTEATFAAFRADLDNTLLTSPERVFAGFVRGWRIAQTAVAGWPRVRVTAPDRRNRWTMPLTSFPESFRQDCNDCYDRLAGRDLLAEMPSRPLRPTTLRHRDFEVRSFASALVMRGRDPATITSLRDLIEIDAFKEALKFFISRKGGKSTSAISHMARSMKAIARHYLDVDSDHLELLATGNHTAVRSKPRSPSRSRSLRWRRCALPISPSWISIGTWSVQDRMERCTSS